MLGFDGEIITHITGDAISRHSASCDGGILSAGKGQVFIGMDVTLFIGRGIFFYIAFGFAIAGLNALQSANTNRSTNVAATGLGFFCCLIAVFCSRVETNADDDDIYYDEISSGLLISEIRRSRQELFESLSLYYRVFIKKEDVSALLDEEDDE